MLTHPDRIYWRDAGVTKRDLAEILQRKSGNACARTLPAACWRWCAARRAPTGQCFFQKHARTGIPTEFLHLVQEKGEKIISIDDLDGLIALVQGGVLEIHARGSQVDDRERANRLVFDLDPGPGTDFKDVIDTAREVRLRLRAPSSKASSRPPAARACTWWCRSGRRRGPWPRLSPTRSRPAWPRTNRPATPPTRSRRGATTASSSIICATAARPPRSCPIPPARAPARRWRCRLSWAELSSLKAANQYTVKNISQRLSKLGADPWAGMGRSRQALPKLK